MDTKLADFTDILGDEIPDSQPLSLPSSNNYDTEVQLDDFANTEKYVRPSKYTGQYAEFRSVEEIDPKYKDVFSYRYFNLVQSRVIDDALYSDKSMVVCAPTGSGKTVIFEMAIVQLLMEIDDKKYSGDFKIIYMAPVKALCTERLTEWYPKLTKLGLLCIEVTGDTDVDFNQLKPYRVIITTPEKWDMLTRRWRDHRGLVEVIKLFLIDEVHILNDDTRGPVLEAVVSRMKTIESSTQSTYRIEQLQKQYNSEDFTEVPSKTEEPPPRIRFIAVSATVSNPEDVATWLGSSDKPAVFHKFGDECRPVALKRVVEGYPCPEGTSIFKFDIILNYKLWPIIQKYHNGKPTLIFCNTRKSVILTAETLSRELTINFNPQQKTKLTALASTIKNKKLQLLVLSGVGCHHAGLLYEERHNIEQAFRNRDLPILITTTTLAMGVNLPAHLVIIKNTQQYVNGAYQEYSISTVLQMVGRAGRPQFDTEATAVIMTRAIDKPRYQALVCGSEPLQSYLHKRLPENLNSEAALGTVNDVAQCVQWLCSTFLYVRAARDPKRYLNLPTNAPQQLISKKIEELCVRAMNGLATAGLITMDEASCIESTEAGRLMSIYYLDLETMKQIMKIDGTESLERLLHLLCESHELADMHLRVDERRCLNTLNRNNAAATIRFPMKGKISTRQMKVNCVIQATLGCLPIPDPSLNQEAMKIMRIADRVCKCLVAYVTRPDLISAQPKFFSAVLNSLILAKCIAAHLWENSIYVSKQLKGIGPTFSTLLATAGKVNFMLLEESHPRDLERIMNKGAPAGNIIRKQIGLLPKYQITMTPIDEKVVSVQLLLLNHSYLSENIEHLTAGETHKSYMVAGDSENHVLLLTSFKDKDLIGVYDGCITHELRRKHNFKHKVIVHCVSTKFVGIDAICEYIFQDLEPVTEPISIDTNSFYFHEDSPPKKSLKKQTCITDTFKERKRRNTDVNITQSKEKKRRENALTEKIRILKESFGKVSKELKDDLQKSEKIVQNIKLDDAQKSENEFLDITNYNTTSIDVSSLNENQYVHQSTFEDCEEDFFMDDSKINNILNEIENEISNGKYPEESKKHVPEIKPPARQGNKCTSSNILLNKNFIWGNRQTKAPSKKSNYNFIDLLEKNIHLSDEEQPIHQKDNSFSETIKQHINKYLENTEHLSKLPNISISKLIEDNKNDEGGNCTENMENIDVLSVIDLNLSKPVYSNIENYKTVLDAGKENITVGQNKMQTNENNKKDKSDDGNFSLHSLIHKKFDNYNILNVQEENDEPKETKTIENDATRDAARYENLSVANTIKLNLNNCSDVQVVSYVKDTISEDDIAYFKTKDIETQDQSVVVVDKNNVTDSESRINEQENSDQCIFNNLVENIKSAETEKPGNIGVIQTMPMISTFVKDFSVLDSVQLDGFNENQIDVTFDCNKPTNTFHISTNEHISTIDKITSRNEDNDAKKGSYKKLYSYSAAKVDVSTHNTDEHQIRIIKRLKVDLDVTEIVTRNNVKEHKTSCKDFKRPECSSNLFVKKLSAKNAIQNDLKHLDPETKLKPVKYISIEEINDCEEIINSSPKYGEKTQQENDVNLNTDNEEEIIDSKNKLKNILHKYNVVLKNKIDKDIRIINDSKDKKLQNESNSKVENKNRPFKITDIHKVDIDLPLPSLISAPANRMPQRISQNTVTEDISESQTIVEPTYEKDRRLIENDVDLNEMPDVFESVSPVPISDFTSENFRLDQSMFDPRTVLQCLTKDDTEIIPPPPEFSDVNYSPNQLHDDRNNEYSQVDEMTDIADLCEISLGNSTGHFIEDNIYNLTPSCEIETMILSQEHDSEEPVRGSWTTMHKNLSSRTRQGQYNRLRDTILTSRRTNLDKFKFINKNKLRM